MNAVFKLITLNVKPVAYIHKDRSIRDNSCQQYKSEFLYSYKQI